MILLNIVKNLLLDALLEAYPQIETIEKYLEITPTTQSKFGHYQCNSAMKLAKLLGNPPRNIAENIVKSIKNHGQFQQISIAGPGFINLTFSKNFLCEKLNQLVLDDRMGIPFPQRPKKIVIDFSSPNIAKEMHVGHLRSTIIGDALARLFEFLGHEVLRLNHLGDWGTAFGMLIAYMKEEVPNVLKDNQQTDLASLMQWYKQSKKRLDENEIFKNKARAEVVKLQSGDEQSLKAWKMICDVSQKAYQQIYDLLDVKIIERGESFYNPLLPQIVQDLENKGLVTISDGAKCIYLNRFQNREKEDLPLIVQKADGGYNYDTTDMAAMWHRVNFEKADRIIIVTDAGQSLHFQMIYEACLKAGYVDQKLQFNHVVFGLVLGADGKKFRTRSGETEKLIDLLETAIVEAKKILKEKDPELKNEEIDEIGKILGISAIKYADLSGNRIHDYVFSYDRMLKFEGNTAAFLMYSYVRIAGIKRKIPELKLEEIRENQKIAVEHDSEIDLGLHLLRFAETLEQIENDLLPNNLTDYLYELACKFNAFFRDCRVIGSKEQNSRLLLCHLSSRAMEIGFNILGLKTVNKM